MRPVPAAPAVDNSQISVDKWLALWRSPNQAGKVQKSTPPNMGGHFAPFRDVDWLRDGLRLCINLWISLLESLHRVAGQPEAEKAQDLGSTAEGPPTAKGDPRFSTLSTAPTTITILKPYTFNCLYIRDKSCTMISSSTDSELGGSAWM